MLAVRFTSIMTALKTSLKMPKLYINQKQFKVSNLMTFGSIQFKNFVSKPKLTANGACMKRGGIETT